MTITITPDVTAISRSTVLSFSSDVGDSSVNDTFWQGNTSIGASGAGLTSGTNELYGVNHT
jgi:hypothetical protein